MMSDFSIKDKLMALLEERGFAEKRARQMDIDDFMALLKLLNENHVHFS
jgi:18S rRNA (adenine1779-N6/adenine1780-N6)-dimethyltransferase